MPFTFVHPIAVWPLARWNAFPLSITGLVAGSIVPDFSYFITLDPYFRAGHSFAGLFVLDLPLALILAWLFHQLVRDPLINNLPDIFYARLARYRYQHWNGYIKKHWLNVCISIVLGGLTHLAWDTFTHQNSLMMELFPWMDQSVEVLGRSMTLYNLAHLVFSAAGLFLCLVFLLHLPTEFKKPRNFNTASYWLALFFSTLLFFGLIVYFIADNRMKAYPSLYMGPYAIMLCSASMLSLIICGLGFYQQSLRLRSMRWRVRVKPDSEPV